MNSRPWLDYDTRAEYRDRNPTCELIRLFWPRAHLQGFVPGSGWIDYDLPGEVNHIWSNGQRPDVVPNLITVCRPVHDWFHSHLPQGRMLCLLAKLRKGEFDVSVIHAVSGKWPIGWVDTLQFTGWMEQRRQEFLAEARA